MSSDNRLNLSISEIPDRKQWALVSPDGEMHLIAESFEEIKLAQLEIAMDAIECGI